MVKLLIESKQVNRTFIDSYVALVALVETLEKMLHQQRDIFGPLFQSRKVNRYHAHPIIKVFTKLP